jgi:hypothetical protein
MQRVRPLNSCAETVPFGMFSLQAISKLLQELTFFCRLVPQAALAVGVGLSQ